MELIKRISMPMMLIALAGATTAASAQFVEQKENPVIEVHEHLGSDQVHTSKWVQKVHDGEHVYILEMTDGELSAEIDGESIPHSQIINKGSVIVVVDEDGKKLYEFKGPKTKGISVYPSQATTLGSNKSNAFAWIASDDEHGEDIELKVNIEQPKVMLGINMSEPSAALRKHLKLGEDRQVIMVEKVIKGLPAAKAGMEAYDIIVSINGSDGASGEILHKELMAHEPGDKMKLWVIRSGEKIELAPKLAAYDGEKLGAARFPAVLEEKRAPADLWTSEDGEKTRVYVERLAEQSAKENAELHEEMMRRAKEALAQAERQVLELRDGQLFVHRQRAADMRDELRERLEALDTERMISGLDERIDLEDRLDTLEDRFDSIEDRMEQIAGLIERMFEKFAEDDED